MPAGKHLHSASTRHAGRSRTILFSTMSNTTPNTTPSAMSGKASAHSHRNKLPLTDPLAEAIRAAQQRHELLPHLAPKSPPRDQPRDPAPYPLVVGVSGGADSVCLLHALVALAPAWNLELHVAHLDHALRPASAADAAWVGQLAQSLGLPFHTERLASGALESHPGGLEDAARQARYTFLAQTARHIATSAGSDYPPTVATAHHQDDQAETLLLHLIHGSGLAGLGGMAWVSTLDETHSQPVRLIRPLLAVSRAEILAALQRMGATWRDDDSNRDARYTRNRIRHQILPALAQINPQIHATLARTAQIIAGDAARLAQSDLELLGALTVQTAPAVPVTALHRTRTAHRIVLDLTRLGALAESTRRGVLRQAVACFPVDLRRLGYTELQTLAHACATDAYPHAPSGPVPLAGGLAWSRLAATHGQPLLLALHLEDCLPWQPATPWLPESVRASQSLPIPGSLPVTLDWTLQAREVTQQELPTSWPATASPWEAWLDLDAPILHNTALRLTTPQPGLRIAPLGMHGRSKSLGDLFTDARIHPTLRPGWPVIVASANFPARQDAPSPTPTPTVIWVCGLATAHSTRLTSATQRVLHLRWIPTQSPGAHHRVVQ